MQSNLEARQSNLEARQSNAEACQSNLEVRQSNLEGQQSNPEARQSDSDARQSNWGNVRKSVSVVIFNFFFCGNNFNSCGKLFFGHKKLPIEPIELH
jgi:hypothetical protein